MNKAEFLAGLRDALAGKLPSGELEDVLSYYEEYFADAGEEHEAEAAEGLGSPASVAAQVLEGRTGQAPSAASAERRPRRLWPIVLGICAAALLLLGVGIRLVFLAQRMPDAPAAGERQPVAAGQEPVVVEQDPVSTPPENKLELAVSEEEMARRKAAWQPREPKVNTGYLARYAAMVTSGNRGAVLEIQK